MSDDTLIIVKHPSIPGAFHFRGYLSESHFLYWYENQFGELEIEVFDAKVRLPVEECVITFKSAES